MKDQIKKVNFILLQTEIEKISCWLTW